MSQPTNVLDRMRIASPCSVGWENMKGDEQVRFCDQCRLNVYNFSELTGEQIAALVSNKEGRVCARLYRRADGTVLTRDCPVGLSAVRKRISKMAGAALTAVLSLCAGAFGQTKPQQDQTCTRVVALKVKKNVVQDERSIFGGVVMDEVGRVIPGAEITLLNEKTKNKLTATTTEDGAFKFSNLASGKYSLEIKAVGFKLYRQKHLKLNSNEEFEASATLVHSGETVLVGILIDTPEIEISNGTTTIRGEGIRRIP